MIQQSPTIPPTDAELLMRFCGGGDDAAFRLLVERHAGLVMTVCRRVLANRQDVEDAFQATFLVLARRAGSIRGSDSIGSWLFKVAHRTAIRAARETHNRSEIQLTDETVIPSPALAHLQERETFELLAVELNRLPENYRAALILFYLEGKSRQATADELDVSEAALKARLARGRQLLRRRLMRRGVALSLAMAVVTATGKTTLAAGLVDQTIAAGLSYAATGTVSAACSAHTVSLAKGFSPMLSTTLTKPILTAAVLLTAGLLVAVGVGTHSSFADANGTGNKNQRQEIQTTVESSQPNQPADSVQQFALADDATKRRSTDKIMRAETQILAALRETTELEFVDTSLRDALEFLADLHDFTMILDETGLSQKGIRSDSPVTLELSGVKLNTALRAILDPLKLTYVVEDGALKVIAVTAAGKGNAEAEPRPDGPLDLSERSEAEARIEEALTETTEIEFVDTSLKDAMEFLSDMHDIQILLDETALSEEGIASDNPITQVLSGISLGSTLNITLKPLGLTYVVDDEVMKVTTIVAEAKRKETRVYLVTTLGEAGYDMDALQEIVDQQGAGDVNVMGDTLVVTQSQHAHRKTMQLLEQLQRAVELQRR